MYSFVYYGLRKGAEPILLPCKRLCSVGYVQNDTRGIFPGIIRTSVRSVRHPYPYTELVYVLYATGTIPGVRVCPCKVPGGGYGHGYNIRVYPGKLL